MSDEIRLFIATHTTGMVTPAYAHSMWKAGATLAAQGVPHYAMLLEDSLVDRGRNRAAAALLESDFTHLLFVDADIQFEPDDIIRLLAADKDLIVASYRKKNDRNEHATSFLPDACDRLHTCDQTGAVKIARAGTGFMMVRRCVFERMADAMPEILYYDHSVKTEKPRKMWNFFYNRLSDKSLWSEDFTFCENWRQLGGDVWLDPYITLSHWGAREHRGSILDHINQKTDSAA